MSEATKVSVNTNAPRVTVDPTDGVCVYTHETPRKHDDNKPRYDLLPLGPLHAVVIVFTEGAKLYSDRNYLAGSGLKWRRVAASACRHVFAWMRGEDVDPQFGQSHLAHAVCCLLMLMHLQEQKKPNDDRAEN